MKITVIIPTYNRNKILCNTIEQILDQDYKDFELLIVDQTEQHDEYTANFLRKLSQFIKVIKVNKPNLPAARNIGIKNSVGDIIVFFDDDMIIPKDTLFKIKKVYTERKDIYALTGFGYSPDSSEKTKYLILGKKIRKKVLTEKLEIVNVPFFNGYFMTFRKSIFDVLGFFDEWIGTQPKAAAEDFEFSLRIKSKGFKLFLLTSLTVIHLALKEGGCEARKDLEKNTDSLLYNRTRLRFYSVYKNINTKNIIELSKAFLYNFYTFFAPLLNRSILINYLKSIEQFLELNKIAYQQANQALKEKIIN